MLVCFDKFSKKLFDFFNIFESCFDKSFRKSFRSCVETSYRARGRYPTTIYTAKVARSPTYTTMSVQYLLYVVH